MQAVGKSDTSVTMLTRYPLAVPLFQQSFCKIRPCLGFRFSEGTMPSEIWISNNHVANFHGWTWFIRAATNGVWIDFSNVLFRVGHGNSDILDNLAGIMARLPNF